MTSKSIGFAPLKSSNEPYGHFGNISSTSPFLRSLSELGHPSIQQRPEDKSTMDLAARLASLMSPPSPASLTTTSVASGIKHNRTLEERLFDATARVKILTSQVAMHMDKEWRNKLFRQLDSLHDPEEWEENDEPVQQSSFSTFLKAICLLRPTVRPGLGLSHGGLLLAAWTSGKNRLTIEFLPNDRVRWVVSRYPGCELEQFAGQTPVSRLFEGLKPYSPEEWFSRC